MSRLLVIAPQRRSQFRITRHHDREWDAGDLGCGELILSLREELSQLEPGHVLKLCARDPGAEVHHACRSADILVRASGASLVLSPPPIIAAEKIGRVAETLAEVLRKLT